MMSMSGEIEALKEKAKLALLDLYDRCQYPIARVLSVSYVSDAGKHGEDYVTVEIEGSKLYSAHLEAIKRVTEEALGKPVNTSFSIEHQEESREPLKAKITMEVSPLGRCYGLH